MIKFIGHLAYEGEKFNYKANEELRQALELKLFNDKKNNINLRSVFTGVVDEREQEKIDIITTRLKKDFGYCDICARDILEYVASIFAKEEVIE